VSVPLLLSGLAFSLLGLALGLWYRNVVGLPVRRIPSWTRPMAFKWGIPALSLLLYLGGLAQLAAIKIVLVLSVSGVTLAAGFVLLRFDKYSADMKSVYYTYSHIRKANPWMEESEVLFRTAERRYPEWSEDRLLELAAGKSIEGLMLLMMVQENGINPLADWELYRTLKRRAAAVAGSGVQGRQEQ
jgi:hypothetical protein